MTVRSIPHPTTPRPRRGSGAWAWGLGLPLLRVALVAVACTAAWVIIGLTAGWTAYPVPPFIAIVAMLPVNVLCLIIVARHVRARGGRLADLVGAQRGRILRDILWGLLWLAVLSVPYTLTISLVVFLLHGDRAPEAFQTVFFDPSAVPALPAPVAFALALIGVLTFAPLNAPAEELLYRGTAQQDLARRVPAPVAIVLISVIFGLQHLWYAATPDAAVVYMCAFFVWGVGSGIIAWRQGRLLPLIVAHGLIDLSMSLPALAIPFLSANGAS